MCPDGRRRRPQLLAPYPWDYVLGSIHYIGDAGIDGEPDPDRRGSEWRRRGAGTTRRSPGAASSGLFDSLAHPDLVRCTAPRFRGTGRPSPAPLTVSASRSRAAGLYKPHGKLYPNPELLREARARGTADHACLGRSCPRERRSRSRPASTTRARRLRDPDGLRPEAAATGAAGVRARRHRRRRAWVRCDRPARPWRRRVPGPAGALGPLGRRRGRPRAHRRAARRGEPRRHRCDVPLGRRRARRHLLAPAAEPRLPASARRGVRARQRPLRPDRRAPEGRRTPGGDCVFAWRRPSAWSRTGSPCPARRRTASASPAEAKASPLRRSR